MSTVYQAFSEQATRTPNAVALVHELAKSQVTYSELRNLAEGYSGQIASLTPPGKLVLIYCNKAIESIALALGCLHAGRPFAWLNKRLRSPQLRRILDLAENDHLVVDASGLISMRAHLAGELTGVNLLGLIDSTPGGAGSMLERASGRLPDNCRLTVLQPGTRGKPAGVPADTMGCCLFTSGSTGTQKGVMVAEGDLQARALTEANAFSYGAGESLLSLLPFSFDVGLNQLMSGLMSGAKLVLLNSWLPQDVTAACVSQRISGIAGVPAIWRDLLAADGLMNKSTDELHLRFITVSGGSLNVREQMRLQELLTHTAIFKTYGQTETFRSTCLKPHELLSHPTSVGQPFPGAEVEIWAAGRLCLAGEFGEVVHRGLGTMLGYLGSDSTIASTSSRMLQDARGPAIFTGDQGYIDRDGYLYLKPRLDSMIKISGNRVYPEEVAEQMRRLPYLKDVAVVATSADGVSRLTAFIVTGAGEKVDVDMIRKDISQQLPGYMVPVEINALSELPRLSSGKSDLVALRELIAAS